VTADPLGLSRDIDQATARLLTTARGIDDASAPSSLPGWSRGHVLTHIARNADGAVNLLTWARTGVVTPQYSSWDARVAAIEEGAGRPLSDQIEDLAQACARFAAAAEIMPAEAWSATIRGTRGSEQPAARVMWSRLKEVEIHHVDLGLAYSPDDWPEVFALRMAHALAGDLGKRTDGPRLVLRTPEAGRDLRLGEAVTSPVVSGPVRAAVAWLTGRSSGAGLTVEPPGSLPDVPVWS